MASRTTARWPTALAPLAVLLATAAAWAAPPPATGLQAEPVLQGLVRDALARNPDLARARLLVRAEEQRVPQAGALPDPTVSLGWQNDGLVPGGDQMGDTYPSLMASQALPYPGKRKGREQVVAAGVRTEEARLGRIRLRLQADVERAFATLLLVRDQQRLLADQTTLWRQAEAIARARNEVGQGSQADLLRAQLELTRLAQTRAALATEERTLRLALNRLAVRPLDATVETSLELAALPLPAAATDALAAAERLSPELAAARLGVAQAEKRTALARLERLPDFAVSAGVMPRLDMEPMWQVGVSISLPVWAGVKQDKALAEAGLQADAGRQGVDDVRQILAWRTHERLEQLALSHELVGLYKGGVLVRSEATVRATLSQYGVGRAPFVAVLEALAGLYADRSAFLALLAQAQGVAIALREASLDAAPDLGGGRAMASAPMPGAGGGMAGAAPSATGATGASAPASAAATSMSGM